MQPEIQARLKIGRPGDKYEQEADRVADTVMRMPDPQLRRPFVEDEEEKTQMQPTGEEQQLQMQPFHEEEELQMKCEQCEEEEKMQMKSSTNGGTPYAPSDITRQLDATRGSGESLPQDLKHEMSQKMGADFSSINIHTGTGAARLNRKLGARAFTYGQDIYFDSGAFNPESSAGKRLLAHELTHTVQQGSSPKIIQKDDNEEQDQVREATESERREYVREAIRYFENAGEFFQRASIRNDKMLVSILRGWHEAVLHNENIINTYLNEDATLLQELRQAYTTGLRNLMTRASAQLNEPTVRLYLQNMHLIPEWAWPGTADFNLATGQEKRDFIQATTNAFNDATTFSGFTTFTDATLRDVLTRLRDLLHSQLEIIKGDLGNDQSLRDNLHNAYQAALDRVLSAAAPQMGQSVTQLYIQYMDLIPEGMENYEPGISTPVPSGVTPDASGNVVFTINGIEITILPDSAQAGSGAETSFSFSHGNINGTTRNGVITSFTGPDPSTVTIQTKYNPTMSPGSPSGYGRGTTATDEARGNTSLGFHESRHGLDFIRYIRDHQPPTFDGAVGDSVADFQAKINDWQQAWQDYSDDMDETSLQNTDCVGTTIDQYNAAQNPPVVTHHCP